MRIRNAIVCALLCLAVQVFAQDDAASFRAVLSSRIVEMGKANQSVLSGADGYLFLKSELRFYSHVSFWGEESAKTGQSEKYKDPLEGIRDFSAQAAKAGVQLILVPVPGKAVIYPDKIESTFPAGKRLDNGFQAFVKVLEKEGIAVLDLVPDFMEMRKSGTDTHCRQDSHWTVAAVKVTAKKLAAMVRNQDWNKPVAVRKVERKTDVVECQGDLVKLAGTRDAAKEKIPLEVVQLDGAPVESDDKSPVLLIGDSHAIVYQSPIPDGIPASGSGLADHIAAELGYAPDLAANMGSGANAPRITLARRRDNLQGKKCVIWCFAVRDLSESSDGWRVVPVVRER